MGNLLQKILAPTTLAVTLLGLGTLPSAAETIAIAPAQSRTVAGQSGGTTQTPDCGAIAATPNHVITVTQQINSMHLRVEATGGQPTLLVIGPDSDERMCAAGKPEMPGLWLPGEYRVYVGDRAGESHNYTLYLEQ
ncbi:MAG: hypothetical protein SAJ12_05815 [Jaaginema sp. PMC 1079.18]|nr:hypothetical protein [Jaaginema sp. PMC 1080.18]MEC4850507.1 hypothetical protein [Jaaginema sp. PMC 1079.18]MEC4864764.1 hypothetical protein [Jaaginema sp. PMC 1078.18]